MEELKQLLADDEYDFQYDIGIAKPISRLQYSDRHHIVQSSALHYSVLSVKAELDQLANGLRALGVLDMVQANPKLLRPLFLFTASPPLTAGQTIDLFRPNLSPIGSNRRDDEESIVMLWVNYLQNIEGIILFFQVTAHTMTSCASNYIVVPKTYAYIIQIHTDSPSMQWAGLSRQGVS